MQMSVSVGMHRFVDKWRGLSCVRVARSGFSQAEMGNSALEHLWGWLYGGAGIVTGLRTIRVLSHCGSRSMAVVAVDSNEGALI